MRLRALTSTEGMELERLIGRALALHRNDVEKYGPALARSISLEEFDRDYLSTFARILMAARSDCLSAQVSNEHARRARHEIAGESCAFEGGYGDPAAAKRAYATGRQYRNQVLGMSIKAHNALSRLGLYLEGNNDKLPISTRLFTSQISDMLKADAPLQRLLDAATIGDDYLKLDRERDQSANILTLICWHSFVDPYPNKRKDMHRLASCWKISKIKSPSVFHRYVRAQSTEHIHEKDGRIVIDGAGPEIIGLLATPLGH